jgi:hypothetical protein
VGPSRMLAAVMAMVVLGEATSAIAACPIERARYRMVHGGPFVLGFHKVTKGRDWVSDLTLFLHSERSNQTHWFMFDQGSARYVSLLAVDDVSAKGWTAEGAVNGKPLMDAMDYLAADQGLRFNPGAPTSKDPPPAYIVLPDLPEVMAKSAQPPETAPLDMFKFHRCAAPNEAGF